MHTYLENYTAELHKIFIIVARSYSDGIAIRYVLPVLCQFTSSNAAYLHFLLLKLQPTRGRNLVHSEKLPERAICFSYTDFFLFILKNISWSQIISGFLLDRFSRLFKQVVGW